MHSVLRLKGNGEGEPWCLLDHLTTYSMRLLILFFLLTISCPALAQDTVVKQVSAEEFQRLMHSIPTAVVIDLRTPEELKQGKVPGARVIDFFGPEFEPAIDSLDRSKTYLLYCASGGRSGETAEHMKQLGFKHIYEMPEGFNGWKKKKMPVAFSNTE